MAAAMAVAAPSSTSTVPELDDDWVNATSRPTSPAQSEMSSVSVIGSPRSVRSLSDFQPDTDSEWSAAVSADSSSVDEPAHEAPIESSADAVNETLAELPTDTPVAHVDNRASIERQQATSEPWNESCGFCSSPDSCPSMGLGYLNGSRVYNGCCLKQQSPSDPRGYHTIQDDQMRLMLLGQQEKKRLLMARDEQNSMSGGPLNQQGTKVGCTDGHQGCNLPPFEVMMQTVRSPSPPSRRGGSRPPALQHEWLQHPWENDHSYRVNFPEVELPMAQANESSRREFYEFYSRDKITHMAPTPPGNEIPRVNFPLRDEKMHVAPTPPAVNMSQKLPSDAEVIDRMRALLGAKIPGEVLQTGDALEVRKWVLQKLAADLELFAPEKKLYEEAEAKATDLGQQLEETTKKLQDTEAHLGDLIAQLQNTQWQLSEAQAANRQPSDKDWKDRAILSLQVKQSSLERSLDSWRDRANQREAELEKLKEMVREAAKSEVEKDSLVSSCVARAKDAETRLAEESKEWREREEYYTSRVSMLEMQLTEADRRIGEAENASLGRVSDLEAKGEEHRSRIESLTGKLADVEKLYREEYMRGYLEIHDMKTRALEAEAKLKMGVEEQFKLKEENKINKDHIECLELQLAQAGERAGEAEDNLKSSVARHTMANEVNTMYKHHLDSLQLQLDDVASAKIALQQKLDDAESALQDKLDAVTSTLQGRIDAAEARVNELTDELEGQVEAMSNAEAGMTFLAAQAEIVLYMMGRLITDERAPLEQFMAIAEELEDPCACEGKCGDECEAQRKEALDIFEAKLNSIISAAGFPDDDEEDEEADEADREQSPAFLPNTSRKPLTIRHIQLDTNEVSGSLDFPQLPHVPEITGTDIHTNFLETNLENARNEIKILAEQIKESQTKANNEIKTLAEKLKESETKATEALDKWAVYDDLWEMLVKALADSTQVDDRARREKLVEDTRGVAMTWDSLFVGGTPTGERWVELMAEVKAELRKTLVDAGVVFEEEENETEEDEEQEEREQQQNEKEHEVDAEEGHQEAEGDLEDDSGIGEDYQEAEEGYPECQACEKAFEYHGDEEGGKEGEQYYDSDGDIFGEYHENEGHDETEETQEDEVYEEAQETHEEEETQEAEQHQPEEGGVTLTSAASTRLTPLLARRDLMERANQVLEMFGATPSPLDYTP